jgi:uncharacterized membrane protein YkgB
MEALMVYFESEYALHFIGFTCNVLLFVFAAPIVKLISGGHTNDKQVSILRAINVAFFLLHLLDLAFVYFNTDYQNVFANAAWTLVIIYFALIFYNISGYFIRKKFGASKEVDENTVYFDSYSSRMISVLLTIVITMIAIMLIIKLWGLDSLLETTGIFGVIIAFLALTNTIWAPDLYYGLVILNSNMLEDGDVVTFGDEEERIYIINKVNFVYTILLDVTNNHRIMIRNAKMIDMRINNLSKKASVEGLRMTHSYKIGYPDIKENEYEAFRKKIDAMFKTTEHEANKDDAILVNEKVPFSWYLKETGDHALEYILIYHIASLPTTRSTKTIRRYLFSTPRVINELVYKASLEQHIDLSTPITLQQVG